MPVWQTFDLGLSMHSNSHLGISVAAMTHLAAATPNLTYDCDTPYPWIDDDIIEGGKMTFRDGTLTPPTGPGFGVDLDRRALDRLHRLYVESGVDDPRHQSAREEFRHVEALYADAGHPERAAFFEFSGGHETAVDRTHTVIEQWAKTDSTAF